MGKKILGGCYVFFILISLGSWILPARAEYPDRPIRMITGWPAGGTVDIPLRSICDAAQKILKQPVVVENMPGASGTKGLAILSTSTPDGYTLGQVLSTGITEKPYVIKVSYDPIKGFTPIMLYGWATYGAAVQKDAPWKTFKDFIEYAKANPGKVKYGTAGHGSTQHMFVERLEGAVPGLKMTHIPFQGESAAMTALLGRHIDIAFVGSSFIPYVQSGELRLLAAYHNGRFASFPDVPSVKEMGYPVAAEGAHGILGPPGLPAPIRAKLQETFREATKDKGFMDTLKMWEIIPDYMPGAEFEVWLKKKYEEIGKTIKEPIK